MMFIKQLCFFIVIIGLFNNNSSIASIPLSDTLKLFKNSVNFLLEYFLSQHIFLASIAVKLFVKLINSAIKYSILCWIYYL